MNAAHKTNSSLPNQVVFLSSIDWDAAWQRHQILAAEYAQRGVQVFFVGNTGFRNFRLGDAGRIIQRLYNMFAGGEKKRNIHPLPPGMRFIPPLVLPPTYPIFRWLNRHWFLPKLIRKLRNRGLHDAPHVFAYTPSQTTIDLVRLLHPELLVYDVVDHFQGHTHPPKDLKRTEEELIRAADILFTTSPLIQKLHEKRHPRAYRIHHGVSNDFFISPPDVPTSHKRLCYFGTLRGDIDYTAFNVLAKAGFEVTLIGPEKEAVSPLHPAIKRIGMISKKDLIEKLKDFDALLLPYTYSKWNEGITPAKIYECFATGRPVLSSDMPGLASMKNLLYVAHTSREFVQLVKKLDEEETPKKVEARIQEARSHSTQKQFQEIQKRIENALRQPLKNRSRADTSPSLPHLLRSVLRGLSWITLFFSAAKAMSLLAHILAARILGPEEYGKASLVLAFSSAGLIAPMLGFPLTLSHFAQQEDSDHKRRMLISTSLICFAAWSFIIILLCATQIDTMKDWIDVDISDAHLILTASLFSALHLTTAAALQGLTWFKKRGIAESLYGFSSVTLLGLAAFSGSIQHTHFILSLVGGLGASTCYNIYQLRKFLSFSISLKYLKTILPYTLIGTLNAAALALIQSPGRIVLYHYASPEAAGTYSVYFTATAQIAFALSMMIWTVLVPLASRPDSQKGTWKGMRKIVAGISAAGFLLFLLTGSSAITIVGKGYALNLTWLVLFAASAAAILVHGIASALYAARGTQGLIISVQGALLAGIVNLLLNTILTPRWGIDGAAGALLLGYVAGLTWYAYNWLSHARIRS